MIYLITLYTTFCPKCKILESKLNNKNIQYQEFTDVDKMIEKGMSTVPWLEVDGKLMDFFEANEWIKNQ